MNIEEKTPAETFMAWVKMPGPGQAFLRWLALIPGIAMIILFSQLIFLTVVSLIFSRSNQMFTSWLMNMLNAAFVPFLIIRYGTPIAPSFRRSVSLALAGVAICLLVLSRLAFELSHPSDENWRYAWLAVGAIVCCASAWRGVRDVKRKLIPA